MQSACIHGRLHKKWGLWYFWDLGSYTQKLCTSTQKWVTQKCYPAAVFTPAQRVFSPQFNRTASSGPKRGCLQLHLTAAREYCINRPQSWELFQTASEAAKPVEARTNCHRTPRGMNKIVHWEVITEREGTINWLISSLWSFWLHLNTPWTFGTFLKKYF